MKTTDELQTEVIRDEDAATILCSVTPAARGYTDEQIEAAAGNICGNNYTKTGLCGCATNKGC